MSDTKSIQMSEAFSMFDPMSFAGAVGEFGIDAWQRAMLYADVRRQRGDQYREHLHEKVPNVLDFACELVLLGMAFDRPINYGMVRILPPPDVEIDPLKRPFIVIDPRAGHGPGIGGFKPDSEIGAAMRAGHVCYFVGFLPDPIEGQTVEDVMRGLAQFVRHVGTLHAGTHGKPAVIGNCQAGWQVMMAASLWPEIFGPIILAGSPLSYWAGDNPMRYAGGLTGGSWLTALTSDLNAGRFDGAWLVQNFENLDPANTLWSKNYHLYANVDTEGPRYLGFEKYWGGHVFLNDVEMQYIVDNLFIGNKLTSASLITSDGLRIDLRNIRSPIVVFCSYGDNITPPAQALGWITDLYRNDEEIASHDQTIVYATHDSIGHLGIFVSGKVARKEHVEFTSNIDLIDLLPAGIYQAVVEEDSDAAHAQPSDNGYLLALRSRGVEEVRAIVKPDPASDLCFKAAARVSEANLAMYRSFLQPWVRGMVSPEMADKLRVLHPVRISYEWWSSANPLASTISDVAARVRENRRSASPNNPLWQMQENASAMIVRMLDTYRDQRDQTYAWLFEHIFGSPLLQAMAGHAADSDEPARPHPGESPEHKAFVQQALQRMRSGMKEGGLLEASVRMLFYIMRWRGEADERHFRHALSLQPSQLPKDFDMDSFRKLVRNQAALLSYDTDSALASIPDLLKNVSADDIRVRARAIDQVVRSGGELGAQEQASLQGMLALLERCAQLKAPAPASLPSKVSAAPAVKPPAAAKPRVLAKARASKQAPEASIKASSPRRAKPAASAAAKPKRPAK